MAAYDSQDYIGAAFDLDYPYQTSPLYTGAVASELTLAGDQQFIPPRYGPSDNSPPPSKRSRPDRPETPVKGTRDSKKQMQMPTPEAVVVEAAADGPVAVVNKPKRVRTGCLTCRERHLKCDEALPNCQNCRKSNRICKRGVRLNFIDTTVKSPPLIPPTADWSGMSSLPCVWPTAQC